MNCPKCGTWNPEDKRVCWRCQTEMPKPVEKKRKQPALFLGLPAWGWAVVVVLFLLLFAGQCLAPLVVGK